MFSVQLPSFLLFGERQGVVIGDDEVSLVVWKGGELRQVATYANDEKGVALFDQHLSENPYRNKGFFVISNVIGEDYRQEHVTHLTGTAKRNFHNRHMRQLFRGSSFFISDTHGREDRGKREDIVLFFGILAATKIDPWLAAITKGDIRYLTGIHGMPHVVSFLRPLLPPPSNDSIVITFHENNVMRLTFFTGKKLRFGRVSKIPAGIDAATLATAMKKELERTLQYLGTMRAFTEGTLTVDCICPGGMMGELVQAMPNAGRFEYRFHSAESLHEKAGIKNSLTEAGRDSSLQVHSLCKRIVLRQLAPQRQMMNYWVHLSAQTLVAVLFAYGVYAYVDVGLTSGEGFFTYASKNDEAEELLNQEKAVYQQELASIADKPSSAKNVRAVASAFDAIESKGLTPTRLLYYLSGALVQSGGVSVDNVKWYVSPGAIDPVSDGVGVIVGDDVYQILEVQGTADGGTQRQVALRAQELVGAFEQRGDIFIEVLEMPPENLSILADEDTSLDRGFSLRLIWRNGEDFPPSYDPRAQEREQQGGAG